MEPELKLTSHEIVNDLLLIQWSDGSESIIPLDCLRDNCPCAGCIGETDVFGTVYKDPPQKKTPASYQVVGIETVGYYAIKPQWGDGHASGIFSLDLLKKMNT